MKVIISDKRGYHDRAGNAYPFGTVAEFSDRLAVKLIGYGIASPAPAPPVKTAVKAPKENAAKRVSKPAPPKPAAEEEDADKDRKKA